MADIVGSVAVKVLPDSTGFNAALQAQLNQIGQQAAGSGQAISRALGGANDALTADRRSAVRSAVPTTPSRQWGVVSRALP